MNKIFNEIWQKNIDNNISELIEIKTNNSVSVMSKKDNFAIKCLAIDLK